MDVIASNGWLSPALAAMEMSQMATQAVWDKDSPLLQLPHVTADVAARLEAAGCSSVFELLEMADEPRREALGPLVSEVQLADIANVANRYPDINVRGRGHWERVGGIWEGGRVEKPEGRDEVDIRIFSFCLWKRERVAWNCFELDGVFGYTCFGKAQGGGTRCARPLLLI